MSFTTLQSLLKQLWHLYILLQLGKQIDFHEQEDVSPDVASEDIPEILES